jgi:predicted ribosomally synthesized peptide with nif11-like leader
MEHAHHFIQRLDDDQNLLEQVRTAYWDTDTMLAIAYQDGYDFTSEELDQAMDEAWGVFDVKPKR